MSANTIERQLFDWDGWDQVDTFALQFYNVVLKVPIGEFLKRAIKQKDARDAQRRLQQEKERAAKQAEATQKRIRDLENELKALKSVPLDLGAQHG